MKDPLCMEIMELIENDSLRELFLYTGYISCMENELSTFSLARGRIQAIKCFWVNIIQTEVCKNANNHSNLSMIL